MSVVETPAARRRDADGASSSSRGVGKGYGAGRRAHARCCATSTSTVERGEFVAIVGYSGAGKTTLINLIAGLTAPDRGTITLDGKPVTRAGRRIAASSSRTTRCCRG